MLAVISIMSSFLCSWLFFTLLGEDVDGIVDFHLMGLIKNVNKHFLHTHANHI